MLIKLLEVSEKENLEVDDNAAAAIVKLSGGDMRKVLNVLESCSLAHKHITMKAVYEVTGRPSPDDVNFIFDALTNKRYNEALEGIVELKN